MYILLDIFYILNAILTYKRYMHWSTNDAINTRSDHFHTKSVYKMAIANDVLSARCHITVTSQWVRWRLKSPAFTQVFIQAQIKENIQAPRHWPLWCEFTGDRWIPRTKGQYRGKCFHLMTSSWIEAFNQRLCVPTFLSLWVCILDRHIQYVRFVQFGNSCCLQRKNEVEFREVRLS